MILKKDLDDLRKREVLTQDEYELFFQSMDEDERGQMIGVVPSGPASRKYDFDGKLLDGDLLDFVLKELVPPYEAEWFDETFRKYGTMVYGIGDYWHWFTKDNITPYALDHGCKPIEEATELELWKMIAISSRYWETFYKRCHRNIKL